MTSNKWQYGITSVASRTDTLLLSTLKSLTAAGFDNPIIFLDGDCRASSVVGFNLRVITYVPKLGHLGNWMSSLFTLYVTNPKADRYAIFEDDCIAVHNLRTYLDSCHFPNKGYWNLLTHNENLPKTNNQKGWHESNQRGKGAVGLVFDNETVKTILTSRKFIERASWTNGRCADGMIISVLKGHGYKEYIHFPSLLQHIGTKSTLGHHFGPVKCFPGESFNPANDLWNFLQSRPQLQSGPKKNNVITNSSSKNKKIYRR
jgi:hypothetical protein